MKTEIYRGPATVGLCGAALIATLFAGNLFAAPTVQTLGGGASSGHSGYLDGETLQALFNTPKGLALDSSGDLFIADYGNNAIREVVDINSSGNGTTETWDKSPDVNAPVGVAFDASDNLYVLNRGGTAAFCTNGSVIEYDMYGFLIATNASHLTNAAAIALDTAGNIYVTERTNLVIRISGTNQTTVATVTASNALLQGIATLPGGSLAVCDSRRNGIYTINPNTGIWTTNAGFNGAGDGTGPNNVGVPNSMAKFLSPYGVAAAGDGTLIVSDYGNDRVKVITVTGITTNLYGVSSNDWISGTPPDQFPGWLDGTVSVPDKLGGVAGRCPAGVLLSPDGGTVYTTEDYYHVFRRTTGASFATFVAVPDAPTGLTAIVQTNGQGQIQVRLTWSPVSTGNVTNYLVERADGVGASGGPYTITGQTSGTSFTDTSVSTGTTYYYVIQAANSGGLGPQSQQVSVTTPTLPPPPPIIGWYDYEFKYPYYLSVFHPLTNGVYVTHNDLSYAIYYDEDRYITLYTSGQAPISSPTNGTFIDTFVPGQTQSIQQPVVLVNTTTNLTIEAVTQANATNGAGGVYAIDSAIASAEIIYQCATPLLVNATNAAQFYISDITTNVIYYYTTDGTDPLNSPTSQSIASTNFITQIGLNVSSNFVFSVRAERSGYVPSPIVTNLFLAANFLGNELSWGFSSGYCSSTFVGSPGEWFYAPVTLTTLGAASAFGLEFDMTVTNLGAHAVAPGAMYFQSMLMKPIPNTDPPLYTNIPPLWYVGSTVNPPPPGALVNYNGSGFVNASVNSSSLNELAAGWFELPGMTNLFNTKIQNLFTYSIAFIEMLPNSQIPNGIIVGGYSFQVPTNAQPGEQYEITLQRPSAVTDGLGENGSAMLIDTPTTGSLSNGPINAIKIVTIGQPKYLAGDVYPFQWFNAGNFGNGNLTTYGANDVQEVFNAAIYFINAPPTNSDLFDAMDSAGGFGTYNATAGYWTPGATLTQAQRNLLFDVNNNTTINQMAFGDGVLDVCDVWTTFVRSQFPNLYWFQRFYTNDTVNGFFGRVAQSITVQTNVSEAVAVPPGGLSLKSADTAQGPASITNTPTVHFAAGDYLASAGQTLSIPVTATIFGPTPLRMLMFNVNVTPLDGSPDLTTPVTFSPNAPFNNSSIYNAELQSNSLVNCAEGFLPTTFPISDNCDVTGSNVIGYLNISIPANATSSSAYALSFAHASASPNGLISFPKTAYTGLITLSSRTNSTYSDGIPDSWRLRYFGTVYNQLSVSNADADGTGMNNWQKYQAGLDPTDPTSVLKAGTDQAMAQNPQDMVLYWPTVNGKTYIIKRSPTLFPGQWTAISTNIGNGTYMEIHDASGGPNRYYEVTTQ